LFDQALAITARAGPDTPPSTYLLANRAYTLTQMGRYAQAETGYRMAAEAARQQGAPLLVYNVRMCVVELYADQGRVADGERELAEAEAERTVEAPQGGAGNFARQLSEARLALLRGQPEAAQVVFSKSLEDSRPSAGNAAALLGRAGAYLLSGRVEASEADARAALAMSKGLQGRKPASFRTGLAWLAIARARSASADKDGAAQAAAAALAQLEPTVAAGHPALAQARHLQRGNAAPM
jgi:tetratricopeptide (TPR) repeat protein